MKKIAVVGAGIVGATIAYSLSKKNVAVHVFDRQTETNDPTLYSLAWLNAFRKTPLDYFLFYDLALHQWPWFHHEIGGDCDLTWGGALNVAISPDYAKTLENHLTPLFQWGYAVERLNQAKFSTLEPHLTWDKISSNAFCPDEGYVDAEKCTRRLLELAEKNGATIHRPKQVKKLLCKNNRIDALDVEDQRMEFDDVILASGVTVADLAATAGIIIPQQNVPIFIVEIEKCKQRFNNIAVLHIFSDRLKDLRQNRDGSFWIAEVGEAGQTYLDPKAHAEKIYQEFAEIFSPAKNLSYTHRIVLLPKPISGKSIFSFSSQVKNLYIALSHSAVVIASKIGEWVAQEVVDEIPVHWLEQFRLPEK